MRAPLTCLVFVLLSLALPASAEWSDPVAHDGGILRVSAVEGVLVAGFAFALSQRRKLMAERVLAGRDPEFEARIVGDATAAGTRFFSRHVRGETATAGRRAG
jgi:hypothetical protein